MADGYEVDPEALRAVSGSFPAGGAAAAKFSVAQLTLATLGERVPLTRVALTSATNQLTDAMSVVEEAA